MSKVITQRSEPIRGTREFVAWMECNAIREGQPLTAPDSVALHPGDGCFYRALGRHTDTGDFSLGYAPERESYL